MRLQSGGCQAELNERTRARSYRMHPASVSHGYRSNESTRNNGGYLRFVALSRLTPAFARRFAVRCSAAAMDAFLARAELSSGVMVSRLRLPPREPIAAIPFRIRSRG